MHIVPQRIGRKGPEARELQKALNAIGYRAPIDGYFGYSTWSAVKKFQVNNGLLGSGEVDYNTIVLMREALKKSGPVVKPRSVSAPSRPMDGGPLAKPKGVRG